MFDVPKSIFSCSLAVQSVPLAAVKTHFGLHFSVVKITFTAAPREENELYLSSICAPTNVIVVCGRHAKADPKRDPRACISDVMKAPRDPMRAQCKFPIEVVCKTAHVCGFGVLVEERARRHPQ